MYINIKKASKSAQPKILPWHLKFQNIHNCAITNSLLTKIPLLPSFKIKKKENNHLRNAKRISATAFKKTCHTQRLSQRVKLEENRLKRSEKITKPLGSSSKKRETPPRARTYTHTHIREKNSMGKLAAFLRQLLFYARLFIFLARHFSSGKICA